MTSSAVLRSLREEEEDALMRYTTKDLTETCWRDDMWLRTYGISSLTPITSLDYLSGSPFWDPMSLNDVARKQGLSLDQLPSGTPGVEYVLQDSQPPHLFVIRKQYKSSIGDRIPLAMYYILDGTAYQAPNLFSVLASRVDRCIDMLRATFDELRKDLDPGRFERCEHVVDEAGHGPYVTSEIEAIHWRYKHGLASTIYSPNYLIETGDYLPADSSKLTKVSMVKARERSQRVVFATFLDYPVPLPASAGKEERN